MRRLFALLLLNCPLALAHAQLSVTVTPTAEQIATALAGVNVEVQQMVIACDSLAYGLFNGSSALPMDEGLALSTGRVADLPVPPVASTIFSGATTEEPDLSLLFGYASLDLCILELDLIPWSDSLSLRISTGTEEIPGYTCNPFDICGVFLSGPGITGAFTNDAINLFTLPGTDIPICNNTVNNGELGTLWADSIYCSSLDPLWYNNTIYFIDNLNGVDVALNGLTVAFTLKAAVSPGAVYHLKLAISDGTDPLNDSVLFLEAGSLSSSDDFSTAVPASRVAGLVVSQLPDRILVRMPPATSGTLLVQSATGALVRSVPVRGEVLDVPFEGLSPGAYLLRLAERQDIRPVRFVVAR